MSYTLNKRQEVILQHIVQVQGSVSVTDIVALVAREGSSVSRITLVRDLALLTHEGLLIREGAGRAVVYRISPRYNLLRKIDVREYFAAPQDERSIQEHFNESVFELLAEPIFTGVEIAELQALHAAFQSHVRRIGSETLIKKEFERIMIEFSWKSSHIEGNTYSLLDTEALLKHHKEAEGKTADETRMILNHKSAFDFIVEHRNEFVHLSRAKIEHVHALLVHDMHIPRNIRTAPVGITGTNYRPLDNQFQIQEAFLSLINLINSKENFFEKSFLCLVLLSYVQAFEDGNKRTARTISNAVLLAHDSVPMSYRAVNETEYKKASILFYEQNNITYFKEVYMEQYAFAVKNYFQ